MTRIIKKYQNRKLYDTDESKYTSLSEISELIRNNISVMVVDVKTKKDITAQTLLMLLAERERNDKYIPVHILEDMVKI